MFYVEELKPKAVLIDGGYRLDSSKGGDWGGQVMVIEELQEATAKTGIPWLVTTQLGDSSEKGKGRDTKKVNPWNVRYAKEWLINPDVVISLQQDEDLALLDEMELAILKFRDGDGPRSTFKIRWNKDTMDYTQLTEEAEGLAPASKDVKF